MGFVSCIFLLAGALIGAILVVWIILSCWLFVLVLLQLAVEHLSCGKLAHSCSHCDVCCSGVMEISEKCVCWYKSTAKVRLLCRTRTIERLTILNDQEPCWWSRSLAMTISLAVDGLAIIS